MEPYCRKLFSTVLALREENAKLRQQRDQMVRMVDEIRMSVLTRLQQQKIDVNILHKAFTDYHDQFQSLMSDARSNFDVQTSNSAELIKHMSGENRFFHEQLNIKRMRYNALNKAHAALNKKYTDMKRQINKAQLKSQPVLRCIRCKARKNVIKCLENDLTDKMREVESVSKKLDSLKVEHKLNKEHLQTAKRKLCEVEDKLKIETKKNFIKTETASSSSDSSTVCVEVTRTPSTSGGDDSPGNLVDHSKCEKEIISLQWSINTKASELVRLNGQLKLIRDEKESAAEEASFYRCRSEHLLAAVKELTVTVSQLERRLADTPEMAFFQKRCEQQLTQLQQLTARVSGLERDLAESEQARETLRVLLTNLATSVSASMYAN